MKIHFIGIGGIGVSALANFYLQKGNQITGSDLSSSEITENLEKHGAKIFIGLHNSQNLSKDTKLVIYSSAVKSNNPELLKATNYKLKIESYPQALGELTKKYFTIAVSGTHGKSTTSAMIALILIKANFDPTVIIGTKLKEFASKSFFKKTEDLSVQAGTNFRMGNSKYLVIEACEWQANFLNYWPKILVLTNIEKDHLDYYKNLNNILKTFKEYISHLPKNGILVANEDDENIHQIINHKSHHPIVIGAGGSNSKFQIQKFSIFIRQLADQFSKSKDVKKLKKILKVPGQHNIYNALAALETARALKISDKISFEALKEFRGIWRRFEVFNLKLKKTKKLKAVKCKLISDYAHHPTEVKATLQATREKWPDKKIWLVFQPHQYQRTYLLFDEFKKAFDQADEIIFPEIVEAKGREEKEFSKKISSQDLVRELKRRKKSAYFIKDFQKIISFLREKVKSDEIIIVMGAGNVYQITLELLKDTI